MAWCFYARILELRMGRLQAQAGGRVRLAGQVVPPQTLLSGRLWAGQQSAQDDDDHDEKDEDEDQDDDEDEDED